MKISPIIHAHRPNSKGLCPIVIRISINGKRIYKPTGEAVPESQWDGHVKSSYPNAKLINAKVEKLISDLKGELLKEELQDRDVTPEVVVKKLAPKVKKMDFYKYCESLLIEWKGEKKDSTLEKYKHELSKIRRYAPHLQFSDVTPEWLKAYEIYQRKELGNMPNTLWRSFKNLKTFFKTALKNRVIKEDPFLHYSTPTFKGGSRGHLTARELDRFIATIDRVTGADLPAGWFFVFSCLTGLRYSDCHQFRSSLHVREGKRLLLNMVKTSEDVSIIITPKIRQALVRIAPFEGKMPTNQECNRAVKVIAAKAGIRKKLTFHCARHTFGYSCAEANVPIEVAAKLMGHRNTKVTSVYYHISNDNVDQWMMKLHG
ncbi:phage integrase SAM-like domain-containing protein [Chitinophaga sp. GCM10012297]|uniref:Site-specific integrase n=1 Tax=Chitinophaga chungangae TaxID=2821488 RepID=A0ABS3YB43_9BACT|nr:site-specific integrase [Chitinophaga chungangae]MBO9151889.1 site-specific integrase [Chitinophaga chungangae]